MFKNNIDQFPKFVLMHLFSYCTSYKSLRVVCKRFAALVPMPDHYVKYNEYKILQPKKMCLDKNSGTNYPNSLEAIEIVYDFYCNDFDFSHLTNLRELYGPAQNFGNFLIKVPDNLKILKFCYRCDLSNTKIEILECSDHKTLETAPITLKELTTFKLHPFCKKFINLESLYASSDSEFDLTCFTKLKRIGIRFDKPYKLPLSIEHINVLFKNCDLDFTYLPNLKTIDLNYFSKSGITVNPGVKTRLIFCVKIEYDRADFIFLTEK